MKNDINATQRMSPGGFAITLFIGTTLYLGLTSYGWQTLLTFKAAIFIALGVFFSVLIIGVAFHILRTFVEKFLFTSTDTTVSETKIKQIKAIITILMILQVVATFYVTKIAFYWYF